MIASRSRPARPSSPSLATAEPTAPRAPPPTASTWSAAVFSAQRSELDRRPEGKAAGKGLLHQDGRNGADQKLRQPVGADMLLEGRASATGRGRTGDRRRG